MEPEPRASTSSGARSEIFSFQRENSSDSEEISDEDKTEFDPQDLLSRKQHFSVCQHRKWHRGRRKQIGKERVADSQNSIPNRPAKRVLTKKKVPRALQRLRNPSDSEGDDDKEKTDGSEPDYSVGKWRLRKRRSSLNEFNTKKKIARTQDGRRKQIRNEDFTWCQSSPLDVFCGNAQGVLYKEKLARGVSEKCIMNSDGKWFTPMEFEIEGRRASWKNWKRSIYSNGYRLEDLITFGCLPNPPRIYGTKKKRKDMQPTPWKKELQRRFHQSSSLGWGDKDASEVVSWDSRAGSRTSPEAGQKESTAAENDQEPQEDVSAVSMPCLSPMQAVACCSSQERTTCSPSPSGSPSDRVPVLSRFDGEVPPNHFPVATSADPPSPLMESSKRVSRKPRRKFSLRCRRKFFTLTSPMGVRILRGQKRLEQMFRNTLGNRKSLQVKIRDIRDHLAGLQQQQQDLLKALKKRGNSNVLDLHNKMDCILHHLKLLITLMQPVIAALGIKCPQ